MSEGQQFHHQKGWAMARGEGASADAQVARGGTGPRRLVIGLLFVLALFAFTYWVALRGGSATYAEVTTVTLETDADRLVVAFEPPDDGCWHVTDDSSAEVLFEGLEVDLRVQPADADCATNHVFPLPIRADELTAGTTVDQVGCATEAIPCGDPVEVTVAG